MFRTWFWTQNIRRRCSRVTCAQSRTPCRGACTDNRGDETVGPKSRAVGEGWGSAECTVASTCRRSGWSFEVVCRVVCGIPIRSPSGDVRRGPAPPRRSRRSLPRHCPTSVEAGSLPAHRSRSRASSADTLHPKSRPLRRTRPDRTRSAHPSHERTANDVRSALF